jgi:tetratricopeptide (TPR) repeat protein
MQMGLTQRRLGNFENAEHDYEDALKQWQSSGNSLWQSNVLNNLGFLQNLRGQYEQAVISFERGLQYARLATYPRGEGVILISLGDLYRDLRSFNEAEQAYMMAQKIVDETHETTMNIYLLISKVALLRIEKRFSEATTFFELNTKTVDTEGSKYEIDLWNLEEAALSLAQENYKGIDKSLNALANVFERQANLTDTFRTNLLLVVHSFMTGDWLRGESLLQDVYESRIRDSAVNILLQVCLEFDDLFQKASQHVIG